MSGEVFTKILIEGGQYSSNKELKHLVSGVKSNMTLIADDGIGIKISQYKKIWRKCNGAKGFVTCRHHEDAQKVFGALIRNKTKFHKDTQFIPIVETITRVRTFHPRYESGARKEKAEDNLYNSFKSTFCS